ncbi:hypothetical protein H4R19_006585, partial [Coemansia spiralis]
NTWTPCAGVVTLHATKRADGSPAGPDTAKLHTSASAAPSSIGTLTPTPTSLAFANVQAPSFVAPPPLPRSARGSVFALREATQQSVAYHSTIAAAMAGGATPGAMCGLPFKTQRSASLPFIRPTAAHSAATAKANPGSSLSKTIDDDEGDCDCSGVGSPRVGLDAAAAAGPSIGLGISSAAPPPPAPSLPLRHRTSYNHLRRPAPYQVAQPAGSPRVDSPQPGAPPSFWCAGGMGRGPRDSPLGPGAATGGRRESDVELALAMSSTFVNGDLLGAHRSLSDIYGMVGVPPSPLSNVALAADALAMQIDATGPQRATGGANSSLGGGPAQQPLPPPKSGFAGPGCEDVGAIGTSMMMAIFDAMAATAASVDGLHGQPQFAPTPGPAGALDAAGLAFDPTIAHATDMWVDWTQAVSSGQLAAGGQAAGEPRGAK